MIWYAYPSPLLELGVTSRKLQLLSHLEFLPDMPAI